MDSWERFSNERTRTIERGRPSFLSLAEKLYFPSFERGGRTDREEVEDSRYFRMLRSISRRISP